MNNTDLGQHWLEDDKYLHAVVELANLSVGDRVLEIGPGTGLLTRKLVDQDLEVTAVEFDKNLIENLEKEFGNQVRIINEDILSFNLSIIKAPYHVVANIPYYLTSRLIRILLESSNKPSTITLTIQKEVAERIAAIPGNMSVLAISAQFYADVELGLVVPRDAFSPPPEVDSQIIKLSLRELSIIDVDTDKFFRIVKAGFGEKRKKLINSLSGGLNIHKEEIKEMIENIGLEENARAQELNFDDWKRLYDQVDLKL